MERETDSPLGQNQACEAGAKSIARAKTWDECGLEEKVERIRQELRATRDTAGYAARNSVEALKIAATHIHGELGQVAIQVQGHGQMGFSAGGEGRGYDPLR